MPLLFLPPPGGNMWLPSWTFGAFGTQWPVTRSWQWLGIWSCPRGSLRVSPETGPSSGTSQCPALLSASVSLSSWAAFPSPGYPGYPGPTWPVFLGPDHRLPPGLGLNADALLALCLSDPPIFAADAPVLCMGIPPPHTLGFLESGGEGEEPGGLAPKTWNPSTQKPFPRPCSFPAASPPWHVAVTF